MTERSKQPTFPGLSDLGNGRMQLDNLRNAKRAMEKAGLSTALVDVLIRDQEATEVTVTLPCVVCGTDLALIFRVGDPVRVWPRAALCESCSRSQEVEVI